MKIYSNHKLIKRYKRISQIVLYSSLGLLVISLLWSINNPDFSDVSVSYLILIPAYMLIQLSTYLANRWGRSPRPDEIVAAQLKGLNNEYTLFNYEIGVPHLLLGPSGLHIIKPYYQQGKIIFNEEKERIEQKGGTHILAKLFAQESIPNILRDSKNEKKDLLAFLQKNSIETDLQPEVINIFYSEEADVHADDAPEITIHANKLKDIIRKMAKNKNFQKEDLQNLKEKLIHAKMSG